MITIHYTTLIGFSNRSIVKPGYGKKKILMMYKKHFGTREGDEIDKPFIMGKI